MKPARHPLAPMAASASFHPRSIMRGRAAIEQMADDMRIACTRAGGVTADDLSLIGWTRAQITLHGAEARERAQIMAGGT